MGPGLRCDGWGTAFAFIVYAEFGKMSTNSGGTMSKRTMNVMVGLPIATLMGSEAAITQRGVDRGSDKATLVVVSAVVTIEVMLVRLVTKVPTVVVCVSLVLIAVCVSLVLIAVCVSLVLIAVCVSLVLIAVMNVE